MEKPMFKFEDGRRPKAKPEENLVIKIKGVSPDGYIYANLEIYKPEGSEVIISASIDYILQRILEEAKKTFPKNPEINVDNNSENVVWVNPPVI